MALTTYALLHAVWKGQLPPEDAAEAIGIPVRNVKTQVNYLGERLETIVETLDSLIAASYPSRRALAEAKQKAAVTLGVTTRQVNRFLARAGGNPRPQPIVEREKLSAGASERKRQHRLLALDVLYGRKTLTEAANLAGRHERSLRRVLDDLSIPVRLPDYDKLTPATRYALAKNVEEGIDSEHLAKLVAAQISRGGQIEEKDRVKTVEKPLIKLLIANLEGETTHYESGFDTFLAQYGVAGRALTFWEKTAIADELRNLL